MFSEGGAIAAASVAVVGFRHGRFTRLTSHPSRLDRLVLRKFGRPDRMLQCEADEATGITGEWRRLVRYSFWH